MTATTEALAPGDVRQLVTFRLSGEEYAVDVAQVQEIVRVGSITPVPRAAAHVLGVMNLRGRIVPVIDLAARLGTGRHDGGESGRLVVAVIGGRTVGMVVDAVTEVLRLPAEAIDPPPDTLRDALGVGYLWGLGKLEGRLLLLVDLPKLLGDDGAADGPEGATGEPA